MAELKPCPFCGGEAFVDIHSYWEIETQGFTDRTYGVVCGDCHMQTRQFFYTENEAIEAWNRRVDNG